MHRIKTATHNIKNNSLYKAITEMPTKEKELKTTI